MNILYCGDSHIEDGLILSVLSLAKHVPEPLQIYVMTMELAFGERKYAPVSDAVVEALDHHVRRIHDDSFVAKTDAAALFYDEMPIANMETRFTPYCMLRLFADQVEELPEKLLYLDNDVICRRDCRELYYQDMGGYEIAGVPDHYGKWFFRNDPFHVDYVNSGVLLMNLDMIRRTGLLRKCRSMCREKKMFMPDQSALNKLACAKKLMPRKFNEQRRLQKNTVLQHFTTSFRFFPWVHTVSVKPWQTERMHEVLKLHEYDDLLEQHRSFRQQTEDKAAPER